MNAVPDPSTTAVPSLLDRALGVFTEVRAREGWVALMLTLNVLLLLVAYYLLKTVREPLILASGGVELKSYSTAGQAVLLMGFVPLYSWLIRKLPRMVLMASTALFFVGNLVIFFILAKLNVPYLGIAFFLWLGIFSLTMISQFWSFANDVYTPEQGKRLFAIVGVGSSIGAVAGSYLAKQLIAPLGPFAMMLVAAAILMVCLSLTYLVDRGGREERPNVQPKADDAEAAKSSNGFSMILGDRYLMLIASVILLLNLVNTMGESVLDMHILKAANASLDPSLDAAGREKAIGVFVGQFRADFFLWVNAIGAAVQLFLVSRIFKYLGIRAALLSLPIIGLIGYGAIAFLAPSLALVRVAKLAENSTDYSLYNTAKQALWLPTSRAEKYGAKMATDTFIVRAGDLVSGLSVPFLIGVGFAAEHFARLNLGFIVLWIVVAVFLGRMNQVRMAALEAKA